MRVFCPEHNRGFFAPRQNPVKCENRGHVLGELDFEGEGQPAEVRWQYCCNCEHFYPLGASQDSMRRCPVCARLSSLRYLCDRCHTISFESKTPAPAKNFTLTSEGSPQPSCAACLEGAPANLYEHNCEALNTVFVTGLNSCPVCNERLDAAPEFPCSVAYYLKRIKAANKLNVTFDYESGLFVRVEDGEYVLVHSGDETTAIVLPRFPRFNTRRHFYDFYQDYYYCANPGAGEVHIVQPATVEAVNGGWKLKAAGVLEVLGQEAKGVATIDRRQDHAVAKSPTAEKPSAKIREHRESTAAPCPHCNSLVERKYAFCWNCGELISANDDSPMTGSASAEPERQLTAGLATDDETTSQHLAVRARPTIFSWAAREEPDSTPSGSHTLPKLIALVLVGLLLGALGLFVVLPRAIRTASAMAGETAKQDPRGGASNAPQEVKDVPSQPMTVATHPEDEVLDRFRARRIAAAPADYSAVLNDLTIAEKQYPNDYRFAYERARISINDSEMHSHHDAFDALWVAAATAIKTGKAREMLSSLEADKDGDLHKLSRGHGEWRQLEDALRNNDNRMLSPKTHH